MRFEFKERYDMYDEEFLENNDMNIVNNEIEENNLENFEEEWENFNANIALKELKKYKKEFLLIVRKELMDLVLENARQGISVFTSREYPKQYSSNDPNPYSKLNEEDINEIINEFKIKGINVKTNAFSRDTVKFQFKLLN